MMINDSGDDSDYDYGSDDDSNNDNKWWWW